jgi:hypothetical protein
VYAAFGTAYGQAFDSKWVHGLWLDQEALLGTGHSALSAWTIRFRDPGDEDNTLVIAIGYT